MTRHVAVPRRHKELVVFRLGGPEAVASHCRGVAYTLQNTTPLEDRQVPHNLWTKQVRANSEHLFWCYHTRMLTAHFGSIRQHHSAKISGS